MIVPHSCAWQKPSRHFLPACAALQRRLASLNVRKSCACWLKTFWSAKIPLRFVTAFPFPRAHLKTKDRALRKAEITFCVRGVFSPLAANIYLNEVDWFFDAVRRKTAEGDYEAVNYHRFADDIVITVSGHHTKRGWAERALQRLQEQIAPLGVELNLEKTRMVNTLKGEAFGFLGFDLRRIRKQSGDGYFILMTPKKKARKAV